MLRRKFQPPQWRSERGQAGEGADDARRLDDPDQQAGNDNLKIHRYAKNLFANYIIDNLSSARPGTFIHHIAKYLPLPTGPTWWRRTWSSCSTGSSR